MHRCLDPCYLYNANIFHRLLIFFFFLLRVSQCKAGQENAFHIVLAIPISYSHKINSLTDIWQYCVACDAAKFKQ